MGKYCFRDILKELKYIVSKLIATVGIPGSGKSKWVKEFASQNEYIVISLDDIRSELGDVSDQSKNDYVYFKSSNQIKELLKSGYNVILDSTGLFKGFHRKIRKLSEETGCEIEFKIFKCDPEIAKLRIKNDLQSGKNRSNVPDSIIDKMYKIFKARKYD